MTTIDEQTDKAAGILGIELVRDTTATQEPGCIHNWIGKRLSNITIVVCGKCGGRKVGNTTQEPDYKAENERLREALVLVLDSVEGCHDCWRFMATDDEKAQIRAALEGE